MRNFRCLDRNTFQFASCAEAENALGKMSEFFHGRFPVKAAWKASNHCRLLASKVKLVFPQTPGIVRKDMECQVWLER